MSIPGFQNPCKSVAKKIGGGFGPAQVVEIFSLLWYKIIYKMKGSGKIFPKFKNFQIIVP